MATILLAEDDSEVMKSVSRLLKLCGYDVIETVNGNDALARLRSAEETIDVVVSDYDMRPCNGLELLEKIRESKELQHLPFILHTGSLNQSVEDRCIELGGVFCSKTSGKLVDMVEELLKK